MSPTTMSWWMPWFLSCKSKSVLAKPLETNAPWRRSRLAWARTRDGSPTPRAVFEALSRPRRLLNRRNVLPSLVVARAVSMMQRVEDAKPRLTRGIEDPQHVRHAVIGFCDTL